MQKLDCEKSVQKKRGEGVESAENGAKRARVAQSSSESSDVEVIETGAGLQLDDLAVDLFEHQRSAVEWMQRREREGHPEGGILADEMGMGKTVEALGLMVSSTYPTAYQRNLVVCPAGLVRQWVREAQGKTGGRVLRRMLIHHGSSRTYSSTELERQDLVVTSYVTLRSEWKKGFAAGRGGRRKSRAAEDEEGEEGEPGDGAPEGHYNVANAGPLLRAKWNRVILDEAHAIRNHVIDTSLAARAVQAQHRWCLTGTPVQNGVDDLFALISFLRMEPFSVHATWQMFTRVSPQNPSARVNRRIRVILNKIMLRRKKNHVASRLQALLPPKRINICRIDFSDANELSFYQRIENFGMSTYSKAISGSFARYRYADILVSLLRMRRACGHPLLAIPNSSKALTSADAPSSPAAPSASSVFVAKGAALSPKNAVVRSLMQKLRQTLDEEDGWVPELCQVCNDASQRLHVGECGHFFCQECVKESPDGGVECMCCSIRLERIYPLADVLALLTDGASREAGSSSADSDVQKSVLEAELEQEEEGMKEILSESFMSSKIRFVIDQIKQKIAVEATAGGDGVVKVCVFSQWIDMLRLMDHFMRRSGLVTFSYNGTMSLLDRSRATDGFWDVTSSAVMLISLKAGGLGLNLNCANIIYLLDPWWNPAVEAQAMDRCHRLGQTKPVEVYRIVMKDTVEDRILRIQAEKEDTTQSILSQDTLADQRAPALSREHLRTLFSNSI